MTVHTTVAHRYENKRTSLDTLARYFLHLALTVTINTFYMLGSHNTVV